MKENLGIHNLNELSEDNLEGAFDSIKVKMKSNVDIITECDGA